MKYRRKKVKVGAADRKVRSLHLANAMTIVNKFLKEKFGNKTPLPQQRVEKIYQFSLLFGQDVPKSDKSVDCFDWLYRKYLSGALGPVASFGKKMVKNVKEMKNAEVVYGAYLTRDANSVYGIYKINCLSNGRFYIGSSKNISARFKVHIEQLLNKEHVNKRLQEDFNNLGKDAFSCEILWKSELPVTDTKLVEMEQHFIDTLSPYYNIQLQAFRPRCPTVAAPKVDKPVRLKSQDKARIQRAIAKLHAPPKPGGINTGRKKRRFKK